jgi:glyoxylase-like metal-dependent hydrolase (beta-lactamase superfamily II)
MKTREINNHTTAFIFDEITGFETAVFLINKPNRYYLIDTFCGADSMRAVLSYIEGLPDRKRLVVINTHFHWDHIWGNCMFRNRDIISHVACRTLIEKNWDEQQETNKEYIMGNNEMTLPNLTFQQSLKYEDDGIEIFHSPGHTRDSISIFDTEQSTLFVGDNIEKPLMFLENKDLNSYLITLEKYIDYQPELIIASHSIDITKEDLTMSINYIKDLISETPISFEDSFVQLIHKKNMLVMNK